MAARKFSLANIPFWPIALGLGLVLCAGLLVMLWLSGIQETKAAFKSGARILIALDTGNIQGKYTPDPDAPVAVPVAAANPDDPVKKPETPDAVASPDALSPPNAALTGTSAAGGTLPIIGPDGTKPWRYYARPFDRNGTQPMIAIIVTGLGEAKETTEAALALPQAVDLSFTPYARDIDSWNVSARAKGHETLVDLPMEPGNFPASDPGPNAMMTDKLPADNNTRFEWALSRTQGYIGFLTPQNEAFSANKELFKGLLTTTANRGLLIAVGREPAKNDIKEMVESGNTASVIADVLVDEELSATAIQTRLASLEQQAKKRGYAVGVAQAYPLTIEQLRLWAEHLAERGIILVPVSAVARLRFS